jgi:ABC-type multidrug transport system fused ATPase/permease subunit
MDKLMGLSKGQKLILGGSVLLFIDTFLPWQSWSYGPLSASWNAWHGFWGVVMCLLVIVLLLWAGARAFGVALPVNVPAGLTTLALGGLVFLFALLKTLIESHRGWASWVGIILAAGVAVGAWFSFQDSGESLPKVATAGAPAPPAPAPPVEPEKPADPS